MIFEEKAYFLKERWTLEMFSAFLRNVLSVSKYLLLMYMLSTRL